MSNRRSRPSRLVIEFWLLAVVLIWAANYPLAKYGITGLNSFVFNGIRYIVATLVVAVPLFARRGQWTPVARDDWGGLFRAGFLANILYQILFVVGLGITTAGNTAVLLATSPLWTIYFHARMFREPISRRMWIGMAISLCGILMIVGGSGAKLAFGRWELVGDLIVLIAAALWGLNNNLQKPLLVRYTPTQLSFIMIAVGAVVLTFISVPSACALEWGSVRWTYYAAAVLSGAFSIGVGNIIWSHGVQRLGPGRTAIFNNLVPVCAFVFSYVSLHEELLIIQLIGAGVTVIGVWVARR